jgi:hypothetical protein
VRKEDWLSQKLSACECASSNVSNVSAVHEEQKTRFASDAAGAEGSIRSYLPNGVAEQALAALAHADITA